VAELVGKVSIHRLAAAHGKNSRLYLGVDRMRAQVMRTYDSAHMDGLLQNTALDVDLLLLHCPSVLSLTPHIYELVDRRPVLLSSVQDLMNVGFWAQVRGRGRVVEGTNQVDLRIEVADHQTILLVTRSLRAVVGVERV